MANNHSTSVIRATEILDPYPERPTSAPGVRQITHPTAVSDLTVAPAPAAARQPSFAASLGPVTTQHTRFTAPIASTLLVVLGQAVLGALIAARTVGPVIGLAIMTAFLTCGLTLIAAQCIAQASGRTMSDESDS